MPRVRYDGPGRLLVAFGKTVDRGNAEQFTDQELRSLHAQPYLRLTVLPEAPKVTADRPSAHGSRRQWAAFAEQQGVTVDDGMTRDQLIAAVTAEAQPEADAGEGHPVHILKED